MPVAAAATIGDLRLVRGCAIGARGAVRSILIVAERPIERLEELAVDLSSRTSVVLARLVLRARHRGREPRLVGADPAEAIAGVGGDAWRARHRGPRARDRRALPACRSTSGSRGGSSRGLPFVFAAWCGRDGRALRGRRAPPRDREGRGPRPPQRDRRGARRPHRPVAAPRSARTSATRSATTSATTSAAVSSASTTKPRTPASCRARACASSTTIAGRRAPAPCARHPPRARRRGRAAERRGGGASRSTEASLFDLGLAADAVRRTQAPERRRDVHRRPQRQLHERLHDELPLLRVLPTARATPRATSCRARSSGKKLQEVVDAGGVQILLQGGLHPELRIEWYEDLFRWMKSEYRLGLHALSPEEILHIAQLEGLTRAAGPRAPARGGARQRARRRRRDPRRPRAPQDRQGQVHERASGSASCASRTRWGCGRARR